MAEKIGLQAVFRDAGFKNGIAQYTKSVNAATQTTDQGAKQITQATQGIGQAWQSVGTLVGGIISTYMVKQLGQAIWSLGELGATTLRQQAAFDELAKQAGGSSDAILAAIQRATDGTVANSDIILAANKGIMLGLGAQADQWEQLAEVARFRARAMGLSVTQALNDITTGIGRQSGQFPGLLQPQAPRGHQFSRLKVYAASHTRPQQERHRRSPLKKQALPARP